MLCGFVRTGTIVPGPILGPDDSFEDYVKHVMEILGINTEYEVAVMVILTQRYFALNPGAYLCWNGEDRFIWGIAALTCKVLNDDIYLNSNIAKASEFMKVEIINQMEIHILKALRYDVSTYDIDIIIDWVKSFADDSEKREAEFNRVNRVPVLGSSLPCIG